MTKDKIAKLIVDISAAKVAGFTAAAAVSDGGTCNFDTPYLYGERFTKKDVAALEAAGFPCSTRRGTLHLLLGAPGQANKHTVFAEAAAKSLKENGWSASVFYVID